MRSFGCRNRGNVEEMVVSCRESDYMLEDLADSDRVEEYMEAMVVRCERGSAEKRGDQSLISHKIC